MNIFKKIEIEHLLLHYTLPYVLYIYKCNNRGSISISILTQKVSQ